MQREPPFGPYASDHCCLSSTLGLAGAAIEEHEGTTMAWKARGEELEDGESTGSKGGWPPV